MTNIEMEKKLADSGFTSKEIALLRFMTERDATTYQILISELRKRFIGGVIFLFIAFALMSGSYFIREDGDLFSTVITLAFTSLVIWYVAPLKIGAKAFRFIKKNNQF